MECVWGAVVEGWNEENSLQVRLPYLAIATAHYMHYSPTCCTINVSTIACQLRLHLSRPLHLPSSPPFIRPTPSKYPSLPLSPSQYHLNPSFTPFLITNYKHSLYRESRALDRNARDTNSQRSDDKRATFKGPHKCTRTGKPLAIVHAVILAITVLNSLALRPATSPGVTHTTTLETVFFSRYATMA